MIAHIVLFTPSADMSARDREAFVGLIRAVFAGIPGIDRVRVGKRTLLGRVYDGMVTMPIEYAAVLEFETVEALRRYLDHPAHAELAQRFFAVAGTALVCDFTMVEPDRVGELVDG